MPLPPGGSTIAYRVWSFAVSAGHVVVLSVVVPVSVSILSTTTFSG
jgi:hypothetical protein